MSLPSPPPDAWGNVPTGPQHPTQQGQRKWFRDGYRPYSAPDPNAGLHDLYGERLASPSRQHLAWLVDFLIVIIIPIYAGVLDRTPGTRLFGVVDFMLIISPQALIVTTLLNFAVLVGITGSSVGMWITNLRAGLVFEVPLPPQNKGGWYFCSVSGGQAFKYAFSHLVFDFLLLGYGQMRIASAKYHQSVGAGSAGFVLLQDVRLVRFYRREALGHTRIQRVPVEY